MRAENKEKFIRAWMEAIKELNQLKYSTMDLELHRTVNACVEQLTTVINKCAEETYGTDEAYTKANSK